jgi:hypothetical protein
VTWTEAGAAVTIAGIGTKPVLNEAGRRSRRPVLLCPGRPVSTGAAAPR